MLIVTHPLSSDIQGHCRVKPLENGMVFSLFTGKDRITSYPVYENLSLFPESEVVFNVFQVSMHMFCRAHSNQV